MDSIDSIENGNCKWRRYYKRSNNRKKTIIRVVATILIT
jgi:hypothetical protein